MMLFFYISAFIITFMVGVIIGFMLFLFHTSGKIAYMKYDVIYDHGDTPANNYISLIKHTAKSDHYLISVKNSIEDTHYVLNDLIKRVELTSVTDEEKHKLTERIKDVYACLETPEINYLVKVVPEDLT